MKDPKAPNENRAWKWLTDDVVLIYEREPNKLKIMELDDHPVAHLRKIRRKIMELDDNNAAAMANFIIGIQNRRAAARKRMKNLPPMLDI